MQESIILITNYEFAKFVFPVFPKLPFPLTSEDWDWRLARDTLTLYMNILGWKVGGNSYTDKSNIPPGWLNSMDYNDFKGPSGAKTWRIYKHILSMLAPASMDKSASSPAEILRDCVLDWAQRRY